MDERLKQEHLEEIEKQQKVDYLVKVQSQKDFIVTEKEKDMNRN